MFFILFISFWCYSAVNTLSIASKDENKASVTIFTSMKVNLNNLNKTYYNDIMTNKSRIRVKRQSSGASKFTEASKMPQVKQLRVFLQLFKNFWDYSYVGGRHPFHPNVPKVVVALYKQKIAEFFFPDVGQEKELAV